MKRQLFLSKLRNCFVNFIIVSFLLSASVASAQLKMDPSGGITLPGPNGGSVTFTPGKDDLGRPVIKEEQKDQNGRLTKRTVHTVNFDGDPVDSIFHFDNTDKLSETIIIIYNKKHQPVVMETHLHDKQTNETIGGTKEFRDANGIWRRQYWDKDKKEYTMASKNALPDKENYAACLPKANLFAGYSFLHTGSGASGLDMPLGANLSFIYNVTSKIGVVADVSYHYRTKGEQKFDREFVLAGLQFKPKNCDQDKPSVFTNLLVGYGRDGFRFKVAKNSASGFAAAAGSGVDIPFSSKKGLRIGTEYVANWIDGKMVSNFRISAGLNLGFECRY